MECYMPKWCLRAVRQRSLTHVPGVLCSLVHVKKYLAITLYTFPFLCSAFLCR